MSTTTTTTMTTIMNPFTKAPRSYTNFPSMQRVTMAMYRKGRRPNVKIKNDDWIWCVHKDVLAAKSEYFAQIHRSNSWVGAVNMLEYIYTGSYTPFGDTEAEMIKEFDAMLALGTKYEIPGFIELVQAERSAYLGPVRSVMEEDSRFESAVASVPFDKAGKQTILSTGEQPDEVKTSAHGSRPTAPKTLVSTPETSKAGNDAKYLSPHGNLKNRKTSTHRRISRSQQDFEHDFSAPTDKLAGLEDIPEEVGTVEATLPTSVVTILLNGLPLTSETSSPVSDVIDAARPKFVPATGSSTNQNTESSLAETLNDDDTSANKIDPVSNKVTGLKDEGEYEDDEPDGTDVACGQGETGVEDGGQSQGSSENQKDAETPPGDMLDSEEDITSSSDESGVSEQSEEYVMFSGHEEGGILWFMWSVFWSGLWISLWLGLLGWMLWTN
ncbi:hypothetical protein EJ08DRAFT_657781 [Tothia fuscella]|uniref:BTB domain-containing protein n=1 Tax=Tothia fuscella TaxID=1048955 RepID=A0A9P4NZH7_9PEZI|nr:hypothetical protein EJ08DRAFT_657781 [Tothia fuscella]